MPATRHTDHVQLELIGEYPGVLKATGWRNLVFCSWVGPGSGAAVEAFASSTQGRHGHGKRHSYVHLIRDKVALPDAAARSGFVQLMRQRNDELACVAIVVGGTGFWASAMRNAVIGVRVLVPTSFEFRMHADSREMLSWLPAAHTRLTGIELSGPILENLLAQVQQLAP